MFPNQCFRAFSLINRLYSISKQSSITLTNCFQKRSLILTVSKFQQSNIQSIVKEPEEEELNESKSVISKVNEKIHNNSCGRLFAVVQLCGKQYKITDEDLIVVNTIWPPTTGDKIRLEKVLLVGCADFTLIGRPILPKDQVAVYATVIEKTTTPTVLWFVKRPRKRFKKTKLNRYPLTFIRINSIDILTGVDEIGDTDGLKDRIF